jgi:hypothetical protein
MVKGQDLVRRHFLVVFECDAFATELVVHTHLGIFAHPHGGSILELVDKDLADVAAIPVIPSPAEKVPPTVRTTQRFAPRCALQDRREH